MAPPHCYGKDDPKLVVHKADQYRSSQADKDHVHGRHPLGYLMRNCMTDAGTSVSQKFDGDQCRLQWLLDSLVEDGQSSIPCHDLEVVVAQKPVPTPASCQSCPSRGQPNLSSNNGDVGQAEKLCFARWRIQMVLAETM